MRELLKDFPVVVDFPVAWGEMDAQQHVNNVVYFRYIENGRMAYFEKIGALRFMQEGLGTVLASTECRYRASITYPDTLSVGARVSKVESDRFTMEYRIVSHQQRKVAAEGSGVIVTLDLKENRKTAIPGELRNNIAAVEATVRLS